MSEVKYGQRSTHECSLVISGAKPRGFWFKSQQRQKKKIKKIRRFISILFGGRVIQYQRILVCIFIVYLDVFISFPEKWANVNRWFHENTSLTHYIMIAGCCFSNGFYETYSSWSVDGQAITDTWKVWNKS